MGRCFGKLGRWSFLVLACCTPQVISFGDDDRPLHTPPVPSANGMPPIPGKSTHQPLSSLGTVAAYQPNWFAGQSFRARVQLNLADANAMTDAFICFSYLGTPVTSLSGSTVSCQGVPNIVQWPRALSSTSLVKHLDNVNPGNSWVTITFTPVDPPGSGSADGTGKGIIIITTNGTQSVVGSVLTLEHFQ